MSDKSHLERAGAYIEKFDGFWAVYQQKNWQSRTVCLGSAATASGAWAKAASRLVPIDTTKAAE